MLNTTDPLFGVEGKIVVVTGGLGQLGRRFASALAERGARVAVLDQKVDYAAAQSSVPAVAEQGMFVEADVRSRQSLLNALSKIEDRLGTPHVLINNAAIDSPPNAPASENCGFEDYPMSSFDSVMEVNVKGVVQCCQVFGGAMSRCKRGSIVNISSVYGMVSPDQRLYEYRRLQGDDFYKPIAYSVSKSSLFNLTRYLATYWAPRNIRVNTLSFAGVFNDQNPAFLAAYTPKVPLGRMATADDYQGAVVFLASDASSYMTGANLVIDGGFTAW